MDFRAILHEIALAGPAKIRRHGMALISVRWQDARFGRTRRNPFASVL